MVGGCADHDDAQAQFPMHAAAKGKSTLGIPRKVGKEFSKADRGGKLPSKKHKKD